MLFSGRLEFYILVLVRIRIIYLNVFYEFRIIVGVLWKLWGLVSIWNKIVVFGVLFYLVNIVNGLNVEKI